jgi:hypothetical protein
MSNIAAALVKARKAFGPAIKTKSNPHLKSKYADLSACLEAVEDALTAAGIWLYQETSECPEGVAVETVFLHESGESLRCGKLHVPAVKSDPQGYGSALTYARRYSLMTACGLAAEDDDGHAANRQPAKADADLMTRAVQASKEGTATYAAFWAGLSKDDRTAIGAKAHADFKAKAAEHDEVTA